AYASCAYHGEQRSFFRDKEGLCGNLRRWVFRNEPSGEPYNEHLDNIAIDLHCEMAVQFVSAGLYDKIPFDSGIAAFILSEKKSENQLRRNWV
ncbi:hypothetical protein NL453_27110, partial [Klebsiella pneumoniae]|nr:hypothetical protein [Klebsiella pneumoniae]